MPTEREIDAAAHVLYDQDHERSDEPPHIPLLALGPQWSGVVSDYKARARTILEAAEAVRG